MPQDDSQGKVLKAQVNWNDLHFYQKSEVLYQIAFAFCNKYISLFKDRTRDQVIQAARSCKQNIVEGFADGMTSTETQLRLLNVSRASLQELREDFKDYIISRGLHFYGLPPGERDSRESSDSRNSRDSGEVSASYARYQKDRQIEQEIRSPRNIRSTTIPAHYYDGNKARYDMMLSYCRIHNKLEDYEPFFDVWGDEEMCNYAITLCHMTDKMMMSFMEKLEKEFITEGGIKERMYKARTGYRQQQDERLKQLEAEMPQLQQQLEKAQAEAARWKAAYDDLRERALNIYNEQKEEIATLKAQIEGMGI